MTKDNRIYWYCANSECDNTLGIVAQKELFVQFDNTLNINTDGVNLNIVCKECGTVKVWYPSLEAVASGYVNSFKRAVAQSVSTVTEKNRY